MSDVVVILYPSLHIKDGAVARLTRSSSDSRQAELLHKNPVECALAYRAQGFSWLHIVDLDGAFAESPVNAECIEAMIKTVDLPMQLSGGIHNLNTVEKWLSKGVQRIVLASAALENPEFVREAAKQFPGHIAVKIDSIGGYVARTGWARISSLKALDFALRVEEAGAATIIFADINMDGALSEINLEAICDFAFALTIPVIVSGGVHSLHDLAELKSYSHAGIAGLILGRALFNGKIDAQEALQLARA